MTGLGSGVPRAEGEEQLFASRESQAKPVQVQRHPGGRAQWQLRSERR